MRCPVCNRIYMSVYTHLRKTACGQREDADRWRIPVTTPATPAVDRDWFGYMQDQHTSILRYRARKAGYHRPLTAAGGRGNVR